MKKKILLIEIILFGLFDKVYAVNKISCGTTSGIPEALPAFIRTIITLIEILVPLGLILFGSVDFFKVVFSEDKKGLDKATKKFLTRSAAGVIVFFIVFITLLLFENMDNSSSTAECIKCFTVDKDSCVVYSEDEEDHTAEKDKDNKEREELDKKREKYRKENEEGAKKEKELAGKEKDPDDVLNGHRGGGPSDGGSSNPGTKTIIIGDSRTVGMCATISNGEWTRCQFANSGGFNMNGDLVIAQGAMGYDWMVSDAIPAVNRVLQSDPGTRYNIVSLMGANGLGADRYVQKYNELAAGDWKDQNIVLVSLNPVKYPYVGYTNESVSRFNDTLKSGTSGKENISYCDTYSQIVNNFESSDGLHYGASTYTKIYQGIKACIGLSE